MRAVCYLALYIDDNTGLRLDPRQVITLGRGGSKLTQGALKIFLPTYFLQNRLLPVPDILRTQFLNKYSLSKF